MSETVIFRDDVSVELIKASASDADVIWAARVSTKGDQSAVDVNADSAIYSKWYNINLGSDRDTISFLEKWNSTTHDLSVLQYPNPENLSRFFMAGLTYQTMGGQVSAGTLLLDNLSLKAEFRNLSKNKKWEMLFASHYFLKGYNNGNKNNNWFNWLSNSK